MFVRIDLDSSTIAKWFWWWEVLAGLPGTLCIIYKYITLISIERRWRMVFSSFPFPKMVSPIPQKIHLNLRTDFPSFLFNTAMFLIIFPVIPMFNSGSTVCYKSGVDMSLPKFATVKDGVCLVGWGIGWGNIHVAISTRNELDNNFVNLHLFKCSCSVGVQDLNVPLIPDRHAKFVTQCYPLPLLWHHLYAALHPTICLCYIVFETGPSIVCSTSPFAFPARMLCCVFSCGSDVSRIQSSWFAVRKHDLFRKHVP